MHRSELVSELRQIANDVEVMERSVSQHERTLNIILEYLSDEDVAGIGLASADAGDDFTGQRISALKFLRTVFPHLSLKRAKDVSETQVWQNVFPS